ncbi:hypothetical protein [Paraburkholderia tuberum]|uniref:Uncharacterized protein n=1 Tax=Paraburkholderia tuberum TaxID=157910 RepID=A0A1H1KGN4_9BURK|nr:hypothetical protein [Paraburkholderia tuberum]SDR60949.1 hypothetical protein SAMN05445850_7461 [Paraburkholderia tuberum]
MKRRKQKHPTPHPDETSEELRARLRRIADATREQAMQPATVPFPEHVTVLAGPLRKVRKKTTDAPSHSGRDGSSDPGMDDQEQRK